MNILIVVGVYPPEICSGAHLIQELAEGLKKQGHNVTVVTSYPRHYLDSKAKNKSFKEFSIENNIEVIRVKTLLYRKDNFIIRGISELLLPFLFFKKIKKNVKRKINAVIVYSPPLPLALVGGKIKHYYKARFILNIQDIFPQNAIDLGILKNKLLIKFFELLEKKIYQSADKITFHSGSGRQFLIKEKEIPSGKVFTLPNWVDLKFYQNLTRDISFRKKYGLEGKFVFLFAGIMGPAQGLDFLIKIAKQVSDIKNIVFLLVGDGMEREKIQKMIEEYSLTNVIIKPFIPKDEYPYLARDADVGIVCLNSKNKTSFIPGKFLGYFASARPIVAFLNKESDGFFLIEKAECGYAVRSDNLEGAVEIVRKMYDKKEELGQFGKNGFNYALNNLTIDICIKKLEKLFI